MSMTENQSQLVLDLAATKQALAERGRCRELLQDPTTGKVCLDGAVGVACGLEMMHESYADLYDSDRAMAVIRALAAQNSRNPINAAAVHTVYFFNDNRDTTDQDCFDLIDKALAEAGGLA